MRPGAVRKQIQDLLRARPFRRFVLTLESGQQVVIAHPENTAFVPDDGGKPGSRDFHVLTKGIRIMSTFGTVSRVSLLDHGKAA